VRRYVNNICLLQFRTVSGSWSAATSVLQCLHSRITVCNKRVTHMSPACGPYLRSRSTRVCMMGKLEPHSLSMLPSSQAVVAVTQTTASAPATIHRKLSFGQHPLVHMVHTPCSLILHGCSALLTNARFRMGVTLPHMPVVAGMKRTPLPAQRVQAVFPDPKHMLHGFGTTGGALALCRGPFGS
jgi:hypothetical protein